MAIDFSSLPLCHDPLCNDSATCFACVKVNGRKRCKALNNTNFKKNNNWCPFYKTTEEVLKEDPKFFERTAKT